jgi:hypothetical protein
LKNYFEASFFRAEGYDVFASRSPLKKMLTPPLEKSHLKLLSDFSKKNLYLKVAPSQQPTNCFLVPGGLEKFLRVLGQLEIAQGALKILPPTPMA